MNTMKTLVLPTLCLAMTGLCAADTVTLSSLLKEMTDPDANTYLPAPRYTARLWSSYDRRTKTPDDPVGWFANGDSSRFIREEKTEGRREYVLLDTKGPGAITRFWVTVARTDGKSTLRFYIDGKCVVADELLKIIGGDALCGVPLSDSVSRETPFLNRGHNLYLPIPYAKSCKVTYESDTLHTPVKGRDGRMRKENFYYNVETRTYAPGTAVESFSMDVLARNRDAIADTNWKLANRLNGIEKGRGEQIVFDGEIQPGASVSRTVTRENGGAIRKLAMAVESGKEPQALRSTVIELTFDGTRTVWVPAGEFFGCGYTYEAYTSWFTSCPGVGRMESRWVMPFEKTCTLTVHNYGKKAVDLSMTELEIGAYRWDPARSMHFGACWHTYSDVPSRKGDERLQYDYDYAELEGEGLFVGTTLSLWQPITQWWGEGDEKVFVDGEKTPSFIGTGTEDYYGYAWCRPQPFDHPFIAQPIGVNQGRTLYGQFRRRNAVNVRNRALDAIPFTKSIRFHMEMWHWNQDIKLDFAPLACWYMRPGGKVNHGADIPAVQRSVRVDEPRGPMPPFKLPSTAVLFQDFEDGTYGDWKATGNAFGTAPARGTLRYQNPVNGFSGQYLVNTFLDRDNSKGTLTSPVFTIEKPFINFLVGGGNYEGQTCVNLVIDGQTVRTATGKNMEGLRWTTWNVSELKGKKAQIVIVDDRTGHFGHINADCFYFDIYRR